MNAQQSKAHQNPAGQELSIEDQIAAELAASLDAITVMEIAYRKFHDRIKRNLLRLSSDPSYGSGLSIAQLLDLVAQDEEGDL